jgi:hypothetical protein
VPSTTETQPKRKPRRLLRQKLLTDAKYRATRAGLAFNIDITDIRIPDRCPVLGITIRRRAGDTSTSPSLDRIVPSLGYVKGNVQIISWRANQLKRDASLEELRLMGRFASKQLRRNRKQ